MIVIWTNQDTSNTRLTVITQKKCNKSTFGKLYCEPSKQNTNIFKSKKSMVTVNHKNLYDVNIQSMIEFRCLLLLINLLQTYPQT